MALGIGLLQGQREEQFLIAAPRRARLQAHIRLDISSLMSEGVPRRAAFDDRYTFEARLGTKRRCTDRHRQESVPSRARLQAHGRLNTSSPGMSPNPGMRHPVTSTSPFVKRQGAERRQLCVSRGSRICPLSPPPLLNLALIVSYVPYSLDSGSRKQSKNGDCVSQIQIFTWFIRHVHLHSLEIPHLVNYAPFPL